jgi:transcriptional regulator of NAD metabolism
VESLLP